MAQSKDKMSEIDEHIMKRFDIQKRLGKGAYGIVWKAIDRKTRDVVAIKKIFDAFRNQTDAQRTYREIMFLQSFKNHPNIVKLHSVHRALNNRDIYLGFEYMETDLHNVIKRKTILKDVHKRYIVYQLLKAIKYIHSGNVIHRDMKPSNVLLDSLCRCKIADFGLARSLSQGSEGSVNGSDGDPTLTDYVATRWYRAPEILIANRRYTKGIDLWSIGCILAEMSLGKPIFPGTSTVNQVEKIMATIPTPSQEDISQVCISGIGSSMIKNASAVQKIPLASILGAGVPSDAIDLINRLLVFNPHDRLTAEEALEHAYVARFRNPDQEVSLEMSVIVPLNDDIRLSVDDYRNKLYELMAAHNQRQSKAGLLVKQKSLVPQVYSRVSKNTENYFKHHMSVHDKSYNSQSESKMSDKKSQWVHTTNIKSDSKVVKKPTNSVTIHKGDVIKASGDYRSNVKKSVADVGKRRLAPKTNTLNTFTHLGKNHGVITQSALMELRAAGLR
ncbi:mitogen-activated protein kinase 15-like [Diorhabda sublineata]|uniref:mitogen-activated protein kinase 15-like n=1 Tax=Diorhabda sublineata TaxID=1163346 RepID=UPI0024E07DBE|nr:mitogen-activated protein kinase 15-like [Diorhabda sublineata]